MRVHRMIHVFDAPRMHADSSFWAALFDGTATTGEAFQVYADPGHPFCVCRGLLAG